MDINNNYFKVWGEVYLEIRYFSDEVFLKNLNNDEYDGIYTEEEGTSIYKRFKKFKNKKIEDMQMEEIDILVLRVMRGRDLCLNF